MSALFRKITPGDIDEVFAVRLSVEENAVTLDELAAMGITPKSTTDALDSVLQGYLCEIGDAVVGFAMADLKTGELSVIAVLSAHERQGIGRELLRRTEALLWSAGHMSISLWTGPDRTSRALRLYQRTGWIESENKENRIYMKKCRPHSALPQASEF